MFVFPLLSKFSMSLFPERSASEEFTKATAAMQKINDPSDAAFEHFSNPKTNRSSVLYGQR